MYAGCPIVLTSATPSVDMYYNSLVGKIKILNLPESYYKSKRPKIEIVNMLTFFDDTGNQQVISPTLIQKLKNTIHRNKQVIILNNRRGYATSVFLKSMNESISCDFCQVPMSFHKSKISYYATIVTIKNKLIKMIYQAMK